MSSVTRFSRFCIQDLLPRLAANSSTADAHDDVGADQASGGIQHRDVEVRGLQDAAREQHEAEHHERGQDDRWRCREKVHAERAGRAARRRNRS